MSFYELALCAEFLRDFRAYVGTDNERVLYGRAFVPSRKRWLQKYQTGRLKLEKYKRWVATVNK